MERYRTSTTMAFNYQIKAIYSFKTKAPSVLGETLRNMKLIAVMDYSMAIESSHPDVLHKTIYPYLPAGTIDDPTVYSYLKFENQTTKQKI